MCGKAICEALPALVPRRSHAKQCADNFLAVGAVRRVFNLALHWMTGSVSSAQDFLAGGSTLTLVLALTSPESIWLLSDRRLSYAGRAPKEDGVKLTIVECADGDALLGYCGLGATGRGMQPSAWMANALRGQNVPMEIALGILANTMQAEMPAHLAQMPDGLAAHSIVAPAFVDGEARLYSIDMALKPDRKGYHFRYTRHIVDDGSTRPMRLGMGGSGAHHISIDDEWSRELLRLQNAYDRGAISAYPVADALARLNEMVCARDPFVGPGCVVGWRNRKGGRLKGGGGTQAYLSGKRIALETIIPCVAHGMDVAALMQVTMQFMAPVFNALNGGQEECALDEEGLSAAVARLPAGPDGNLR